MKNQILIYALIVFGIVCAAAVTHGQTPCELIVRQTDTGEPELHLSNAFVKLVVLPQSSGRISSLIFTDADGASVIPPLMETVRSEPLLPDEVHSNRIGYTDWFWGKHVPPKRNYAYEIIDQTAQTCAVRLQHRIDDLKIERTVRLRSQSMIVEQTVTLTNIGDQPVTPTYWAHLVLDGSLFIPSDGSGSTSYVPIGVGSNRRKGRRCIDATKPGVTRWTQPLGQTFFLPGEPWLVRLACNKPVAVGMRMDAQGLDPDGMLYIWEGDTGDSPAVTIEMIAGDLTLTPGEAKTYSVELLGWRQSQTFVNLVGDFVISQTDAGDWRVLALCDTAAQEISFIDDQGSQTLSLPALQAGAVQTVVRGPK